MLKEGGIYKVFLYTRGFPAFSHLLMKKLTYEKDEANEVMEKMKFEDEMKTR